MRRLGEWHADVANPPAVTRDPKDDYLVALALSSVAEAITSGDDDLHTAKDLGVRGYHSTRTPDAPRHLIAPLVIDDARKRTPEPEAVVSGRMKAKDSLIAEAPKGTSSSR